MYALEGKAFFDNIRRSVKISYFVASIIPLALLVYFSVKYVYPYVTGGNTSTVPLSIGIVLVLAVVVSVLGLLLTTKATNSSIKSAQELNNKLNSLFSITKQFRETMYLDVLLQNIMKAAMELTSAESGSLLLFDDSGNLKVNVSEGKHPLNVNNNTVKPGLGIASWVGETGEAALVNDVTKDQRFDPGLDGESDLKTKSILCVPLIYSNNIIGVIELRNKINGDFTNQDKALLHSLADQASISIKQNKSSEIQHSDFIHITEMLVGAQDFIQNKKGHARRVANYANQIGKSLDFNEDELKKLYYASLLHDIGMLKIDAKDLKEKDKIINHPKVGHDLIKSISVWSDSADIILHHHERFDGTGYPLARKMDEIPLGARILFVADTFDVLTSNYSYREPLDFRSAMSEIEINAGTQFDPEIVKVFKSALSDSGMLND